MRGAMRQCAPRSTHRCGALQLAQFGAYYAAYQGGWFDSIFFYWDANRKRDTSVARNKLNVPARKSIGFACAKWFMIARFGLRFFFNLHSIVSINKNIFKAIHKSLQTQPNIELIYMV